MVISTENSIMIMNRHDNLIMLLAELKSAHAIYEFSWIGLILVSLYILKFCRMLVGTHDWL